MPGHEGRTEDKVTGQILSLITAAAEPLETKEIELQLVPLSKAKVSRVKVLYRLNLLRGDGLIKGKPVGSGKGTWIWWAGGGWEEKR